jgi:glycosyltransferase involved in cell wall biosynthesis
MNVLIAANTTWYILNFRSRFISTLIEQGYRVTVLAPKDDYVSRIVALGVQHKHLQLNNASTNPLRELVTLARLVGLLRRKRPELILTYTPKVNIYIALAARLLGIPVVANVSGLGSGFISGGLLKKVMLGLYRMALGYPHKVFFQNQDDRAEFIRANLVPSDKTGLLPGSGVDLDRFTPVQRTSKNTFVFLLAARLLWDKGVGEYVEAARQVKSKYPEVEFRFLGFLDVQNPSAVSRAEVEHWESEGVITYLGATDDVRPYYADADCVVLPSYREGMPRTLLEASAMCVPVIGTDAVGCRDAVEDGKTGFLCKPKNAPDLAEKMEKMILLTPEQRAEMGKAGRAKMEAEFDERIVIERYLEVIGEITNEGRGHISG